MTDQCTRKTRCVDSGYTDSFVQTLMGDTNIKERTVMETHWLDLVHVHMCLACEGNKKAPQTTASKATPGDVDKATVFSLFLSQETFLREHDLSMTHAMHVQGPGHSAESNKQFFSG